MKNHTRIKDITGEKFGEMTVLKFSHINEHRQAMWHCACSCGNKTISVGSSIRSGLVKSCGCRSGYFKNHSAWNKDKKIQTNTGRTHFKKGVTSWNKGLPNLKIRKEHHWNWKGGISSTNDKIRKSVEYKEWRDSVYKKDNWTCQICKEKLTNRKIIAHHKKSFSKYIKLRFNVSNGITLCRKCHCKIHKFEA